MKKKIIGIALITLSLISLYGCGKDETSSSSNSDSSSNTSQKSAIGDKTVSDIINANKANKALNIGIDVSEYTSTTVTTKVEVTETVETAESQNSPQTEINKAEVTP